MRGSSHEQIHNNLILPYINIDTVTSYVDFMNKFLDNMHPKVSEFLATYKHDPIKLRQVSGRLSSLCYHKAMYNRYGRKSFYITEELCDDLLNTDIPISPQFIKLPFPCIEIMINPTERLKFITWDKDKNQLETYPGSFLVMIEDDYLTSSSILFGKDRKYLDAQDPRLGSIPIGALSGKTVEDVMKEHAKKLYDSGGRDSPEISEITMLIIRLIVNSVLYISAPSCMKTVLLPPDQVLGISNGERKRLRSERPGNVTITVCGTRRIGSESDNHVTGRPLTKRVQVAGHWRLQPRGPRDDPEKQWVDLIRIEPFWRGPDFAEQVDKQYVVK